MPVLIYVSFDIDCFMSPTDKPLVWLHGEVKSPPFSAVARLEAGLLLRTAEGPMRKEKRARLEKSGWQIGSSQDFLGLNKVEGALLDIRLTLASALRRARLERHVSQAALAKQLGSSQSRVAKMEAGDASVSVDLLMRSLIVTGSTNAEIGRAISAVRSTRSRPVRRTA
jgi:hypothetical protein